MSRRCSVLLLALLISFAPTSAFAAPPPTYLLFESGQTRPLALSPNGLQLFAVNTPDNTLEIFDVAVNGSLTRAGSVPVGMEPVAVAARSNSEVWVVNHLSDSVSVVTLTPTPRVTRTLLVGDEPYDIVFAGSSGNRAFITTAHRGQNSPFPRSEYDTPRVGRADVWVFDATDANSLGSGLGGNALTIVTLFGDKARALAASSDGSTVYAGVFRSGNQTTSVIEAAVCDTSSPGTVQGSCSVQGASMPGGLPLPHENQQSIAGPEVGLIVKLNRDGVSPGIWQDELGRNWNNAVKFNLPDRDVFEIDADANPPSADSNCITTQCFTGVGTTLFNMTVNPMSGKVYVSNTEARNEVRFEGPGIVASAPGGKTQPGEPDSVVGHLAESRITVLDGSTVSPRHLNHHIPYGTFPVPAGVEDDSLATPTQMAVTSDGATLYVAAFGSAKIGVFATSELETNSFTPDSNDHITLGGGGPSGLVLNANDTKLYVMTRFDNSVRVIDTATATEITAQKLALHTPEDGSIIDGRPFLYDAILTGSNGESSCSSCHIFGDMDDLAWDLGNPDDNEVANTNPFNPVIPSFLDPLPRVFHPMKGPMTTQSLRGLANMGPQHWRGDRQGDEEAGFNAFNVAFPGLVGRDEGQLSTTQMQAFTDFALQIRYPPNPIRQLDNSLRSDEMDGFTLYNGGTSDSVANCNGCHTLAALGGFFGGDGQSTFEGETQHFKVPHLRNAYQKIGMFGTPDVGTFDPPYTHQGDQVRGFGFLHDGSVDTVNRFVSSSVFSILPAQQDDLEAFIVAFDTDLAPIVGQQITLTAGNALVAEPRIALMITRAMMDFDSQILGGTVKECDVIAKTLDGTSERGYVRESDGMFRPDDGGVAISDLALRGLVAVGAEITYTCMPPGSGYRTGIDRDEDDLTNGVETGTLFFNGPLDTGTDPALFDTDGDGFGDGLEVSQGSDPTDPLSFPTSVPGLQGWGLIFLITSILGWTFVTIWRGRVGR